jgi:hypothetical protein
VGVNRAAVTVQQRPAQTPHYRRWQCGPPHSQHRRAVGQHLGVDHVGLVRSRDGLAQPGRVGVLHQGERTAGLLHRVAQRQPRPPVGSTTTIDPANGASRSDSRARPANVGATLKSSRTPGPRTATRWAATMPASRPIDTALGSPTVTEGSPFHHGDRRCQPCLEATSGTDNRLGVLEPGEPSSALELDLTVHSDTTPTSKARPPAHPGMSVIRCHGPRPADLDRPHPFPQPGLLGKTDPNDNLLNEPHAQGFSVTVRVPPEATLSDHHEHEGPTTNT